MQTLTYYRTDRHHPDKVETTEETVEEMAATKGLQNNPRANHRHIKVETMEATVEETEAIRNHLDQAAEMEAVNVAKAGNHDNLPVT
jgi:hypothetical protein